MRPLLFFLAFLFFGVIPALRFVATESAEQAPPPTDPTVVENLKADRIPSKTDDEAIRRTQKTKTKTTNPEVHEFQSDVNRVMHIIINSIYSNKDVFLRELISNASDALDKIRYNGLRDPSQLGEGEQANLEIKIKSDPDANTLTITDRGVGMTKEDLITKLGTIAKSGTKEFAEAVRSADMNMIGQFGVGFYSGFLVADKITVRSKNNDDPKQWIWESQAENSFTIVEDPAGNTLGRGTEIVLYLKEEASDYLETQMLKDLIKRYSEFINYPIYLWTSEYVNEEVPDEDAVEEDNSEDVFLDSEDGEEKKQEEKTPKMKTIQKQVSDWQLQNENKPIWTRNPKEVTLEEYNKFYRTFSKDDKDPLKHLHFIGEGEIDFKAILYVPAVSPAGLFQPDKEGRHKGLKLYVKRVFITDDFSDMFPQYLNFIQGMVDSDNLPLNVSREVLQQDRVLALIKKKLTRKVIAMIQELANDKEKYAEFYKQYASNIKYGVASDHANRPRLAKLLRYYSSKTKELSSFDDYVTRMKEGQNNIYYVAGESVESLEKSPFVEKLLHRGYEVLYMVDSIDEWTMNALPRFDNKYPLVNASKDGSKIEQDESADEEVKEKLQSYAEEYRSLLDFFVDRLRGKIGRAIPSDNLVRTPCAILAGPGGYTANMERLMKAQAYLDQKQLAHLKAQRVLEINPKHPLIAELNRMLKEDKTNPIAADLADLLYETSSLQSGYSIDDPTGYARRVYKMMKLSLQLNLDPEAFDFEPQQQHQQQQHEEVKDEL